MKLKKKAKEIEKKRSECQGSIDEILRALKDEFGVDSMEGARKLLAKMERDIEDKREDYTRKMRKFEEDYGDAIRNFG